MLPSWWNWMAFMPPTTVGITCSLEYRALGQMRGPSTASCKAMP